MREEIARKRAVRLLNLKKPQHPPDIYFIRRNVNLLEKYLDDHEMEDVVNNAPPKSK